MNWTGGRGKLNLGGGEEDESKGELVTRRMEGAGREDEGEARGMEKMVERMEKVKNPLLI